MKEAQLSKEEHLKRKSNGLRGTISDSLNNEITNAIGKEDKSIIKFHGIYQQDDRDLREIRAKKKLERLYTFMIRLRIPGGNISADQWLGINHIAGKNSTGVIKITTRQTVQLHGLVKSKLKPTIQAFDKIQLDSIAACGDVNRNVISSAHPASSPLFEEIHQYTKAISRRLKPKTQAYYEIWLDKEKIATKTEDDPLYKETYLPRKFKIAIAIPPHNDVDVFTNDLGLIAIVEDDTLKGFNIAVGGGMSETHGNPNTYARLATTLGFVPVGDKLFQAIYEVLTIQRDYGNREDRKQARIKYTIDKMGVQKFREELERRIGFKLQPPKVYAFQQRKDYYGWVKDAHNLWHYTLFIENGRVLDTPEISLKTGLLKIAETKKANFRFTCNQNLILSDIKPEDKAEIHNLLNAYKLIQNTDKTLNFRSNSIACSALPTCPLAMAESQRYLPKLIDKIEPILEKYNLQDENIVTRMSGCPNGCSRPYAAEIAFVGTAMGKYNMQLGGDNKGFRLNKLYKKNLDEKAILEELDNLFFQFSQERLEGEGFGDFTVRKALV